MRTEYLDRLEKDPKLYGSDKMKKRFYLLLSLVIPIFMVWVGIWIFRDAMITGICLTLTYSVSIFIHRKFRNRALWKWMSKQDFSGNFRSKMKHNLFFSLSITAISSIFLVLYCAYISWGPQKLRLPFVYLATSQDLIYYFWLGVLYVVILPPLETYFFFGLHTFSWEQRIGQIIIPMTYGLMEMIWVVPIMENNLWRMLFTVMSTGFGYYLYKLRKTNDILKMMAVRQAMANTVGIVIFFLLVLNKPASPVNFQKYDKKNIFMV